MTNRIKKNIFREYDIRGIFEEELNEQSVKLIGYYLGEKIKALLHNPPADFPKILNIIDVDGVRINFENGWGLVRASNTTPVQVTRFESPDKALTKTYEKHISIN